MLSLEELSQIDAVAMQFKVDRLLGISHLSAHRVLCLGAFDSTLCCHMESQV